MCHPPGGCQHPPCKTERYLNKSCHVRRGTCPLPSMQGIGRYSHTVSYPFLSHGIMCQGELRRGFHIDYVLPHSHGQFQYYGWKPSPCSVQFWCISGLSENNGERGQGQAPAWRSPLRGTINILPNAMQQHRPPSLAATMEKSSAYVLHQCALKTKCTLKLHAYVPS
jgi:hypothetical protein